MIFSFLLSRIGIMISGAILLIALLFGGRWYVNYWKGRAHKAEAQAIVLEAQVKAKEIEVEYAKKIAPIAEISKRRKVKPVVVVKEVPKPVAVTVPAPDPLEWADAVAVADAVNRHWGLRDQRGR